MEQIGKPSLGGATIVPQMHEKKQKKRENGCKVCAHHFGHLEANRKKSFTTVFTSCIVVVHIRIKHFVVSLHDATKNLSSRRAGGTETARYGTAT